VICGGGPRGRRFAPMNSILSVAFDGIVYASWLFLMSPD